MTTGSSSEIRVRRIEGDRALRRTVAAICAGTCGFCCFGAIPGATNALKLLPAAFPQVAVIGLCLPRMWEPGYVFRLRQQSAHPFIGAAGQAAASATVVAVSRFGPPSRPTCRARCSWVLGRHSHAGPARFSMRPDFRLTGVIPGCSAQPKMTPLYTPHGGNAASVALRRAAQRHRDCPSGGATAVTGAIPSKNSARNLDGQFLDSEGGVNEKMSIAREWQSGSVLDRHWPQGCEIKAAQSDFLVTEIWSRFSYWKPLIIT